MSVADDADRMSIEVLPATDRWDDFVRFMVPRGPGAGGRRVDMISGYVGTVALFERHGFARVVETTAHSGGVTRWVMRRTVTP